MHKKGVCECSQARIPKASIARGNSVWHNVDYWELLTVSSDSHTPRIDRNAGVAIHLFCAVDITTAVIRGV